METSQKSKLEKHLLFEIETQGFDEECAHEMARAYRSHHIVKIGKRTIDDNLYTSSERVSELVYRFRVYDVYIIEMLSFFQRFRHHVRKACTAALRYMGVLPPLVIIKFYTSLPEMDGA